MFRSQFHTAHILYAELPWLPTRVEKKLRFGIRFMNVSGLSSYHSVCVFLRFPGLHRCRGGLWGLGDGAGCLQDVFLVAL